MKQYTPITELKGIGEKTAQLFEKMDVCTVTDLLKKYPADYEVFEPLAKLSEAKPGEVHAFFLKVKGAASTRVSGKRTILTIPAGQGAASVSLVFFNMPYLKKTLLPGKELVFRGKLTMRGVGYYLEQPKMMELYEYERLVGVLQPRYSLTKGITNLTVQKAVRQGLQHYLFAQERYPKEILEKFALVPEKDAIFQMHFPDTYETLLQARKRIVFDEFFTFLYGLKSSQGAQKLIPNHFPMLETAHTARFLEQLPFRLTSQQEKVWEELKEELSSEHTMNRLIQGDVGSGKTVLAILALAMVCANNYQGVLMAPTEVLATQHYETVSGYVRNYALPFTPVLLVGSLTEKQKKEAYRKIESGEANLVIGTHAVIEEKVRFANLALVVTDEQHRFGVRQREKLSDKGEDPHILVMSATPIPRTLAMILYGDLSISTIRELPASRKPIKNAVVTQEYREKAYKFMTKEIRNGRQVYVICPMALEGETQELENVVEYTQKLRQALPQEIQISYLHGKMRPAEKQRIMEEFAQGNIDVLVSTTVIEVGINVPNATVMLVENAERFGLCQLHQLRGRVGRGSEQSYCIFMSGTEKKEVMERLEILGHSNDGFEIAEKDMQLRGPGDIFGVRQSGEFRFPVGDVLKDSETLKEAEHLAQDVLAHPAQYAGLIENLTESGFVNFVDFRTI